MSTRTKMKTTLMSMSSVITKWVNEVEAGNGPLKDVFLFSLPSRIATTDLSSPHVTCTVFNALYLEKLQRRCLKKEFRQILPQSFFHFLFRCLLKVMIIIVVVVILKAFCIFKKKKTKKGLLSL